MMTKLPTGFTMDLDSVHYIMYEGTYNFGKEAVLEIMCDGATVRLFGTPEQISESKAMILDNINERIKQCQKNQKK